MKLALALPRARARVEIVPLIDVVFFLLATYVLISLSMTRHQGVSLPLPKPVPEQTATPPLPQVIVTLGADGTLWWNDQPP